MLRPPSTRLSGLFSLLVFLSVPISTILLAGCSIGRTTRTEQVSTDEISRGSAVSLHRNSAEAALDRGEQASMEGRFDEAVEEFTDAYHDENAKPDTRAAALYDLGKLYSNVLNPHRDPETSRGYLTRLIEEYPESELREKAETAIRELQLPN